MYDRERRPACVGREVRAVFPLVRGLGHEQIQPLVAKSQRVSASGRLAQWAEIRPAIYFRFDGFERELPAASAGVCR